MAALEDWQDNGGFIPHVQIQNIIEEAETDSGHEHDDKSEARRGDEDPLHLKRTIKYQAMLRTAPPNLTFFPFDTITFEIVIKSFSITRSGGNMDGGGPGRRVLVPLVHPRIRSQHVYTMHPDYLPEWSFVGISTRQSEKVRPIVASAIAAITALMLPVALSLLAR